MLRRALRQFGRILRGAIAEWNEDNVYRMAAALAFYTLFSLTPIVMIAIAVAGFFVSQERALEGILIQAEFLVGTAGADAVRFLVRNAPAREESRIATLVGIGTILFLATAVFTELKDALNTIWEVKPRPGLGLIEMIRARFLSFALVLVIGFLLLVSLVASAAIASLGERLQGVLPLPIPVLKVGNFLVSVMVITVLFALIYQVLPDATVHWRDVWLGAGMTALLFVVGKSLFGIYLGHSTIGTSFGAAGSLVIVLLWAYYSSQILFFGAELTEVWARRRGSHIVPDEHAVPADRKGELPSQTSKKEPERAGELAGAERRR